MVDKRIILVWGIILLFLFLSVVPMSIGLNVNQLNQKLLLIINNDEIDWWTMYGHDLNRTRCTSSKGPEPNNVLWIQYLHDSIDYTSPAILDNRVYIGAKENFFCLNAETGTVIWQNTIPWIWKSSPAIYDGKVYFGGASNDRGIYCLNATTGAIIWRIQPPGDIQSPVWSSPAVHDGKVIIGSRNPDPGRLYCLDADTGKEIWIYQNIKDPGDVAIYDNKIYFGTSGSSVYCIDEDSGEKIWENPNVGDNDSHIYVAINDGRLFAGSDDLYCLNIDNGDLIWKYPTDEFINNLCVAEGNIYFNAGSSLFCLNASFGEKKWEYKNTDAESSPIFADGKIYTSRYGNFRDEILCLDAYTGNLIWEYNVVYPIRSSPAIVNGYLYVTLSSGEVYCIGGESDNHPPLTPKEILGPKKVLPDNSYTYSTSTYDPDGDLLFYYWDLQYYFDPEWEGPFFSNETIERDKYFNVRVGVTITLGVLVEDLYHARSDWQKIDVYVSRSRSLYYFNWLSFLEGFPILQKLLNKF